MAMYDPSHGFRHVGRVRKTALRIATRVVYRQHEYQLGSTYIPWHETCLELRWSVCSISILCVPSVQDADKLDAIRA
jgi:hypothetical protein